MVTVREKLRLDFYNNIRPLFVKDECEYCCSKEELHLHHEDKRFVECTDECMKFVNISLDDDIECVDKFELEKTRNIMLGIQLRVKYATLCKKCHIEVHKLERHDNNRMLYGKKLILENKKLEREHYVLNELPLKLNELVGIRFIGERKEELIKMINHRDNRNRLQKSISIINRYLSENKHPYLILSKRSSERVDGKVKSYTYWEVIKLHKR